MPRLLWNTGAAETNASALVRSSSSGTGPALSAPAPAKATFNPPAHRYRLYSFCSMDPRDSNWLPSLEASDVKLFNHRVPIPGMALIMWQVTPQKSRKYAWLPYLRALNLLASEHPPDLTSQTLLLQDKATSPSQCLGLKTFTVQNLYSYQVR